MATKCLFCFADVEIEDLKRRIGDAVMQIKQNSTLWFEHNLMFNLRCMFLYTSQLFLVGVVFHYYMQLRASSRWALKWEPSQTMKIYVGECTLTQPLIIIVKLCTLY